MTTWLIMQAIGAVAVGVLGALFLRADVLSAASAEIVSALSILNAAIFPTVILSATVLKASGLSRDLIERYRVALRKQVSFFFGILLFSLMAILVIIVGRSANWKLEFSLPGIDHRFVWSGIFNLAIGFLLTIVGCRLPAFFRALMSLVDVHIDSVAEEAADRRRQRREARQQELDGLPSVSTHLRAPEAFQFQQVDTRAG